MTIDLDALEKLADICLTVDPIGPGWYDEAHLRVHMEPSDAVFAEAANPATIKALITELREARGLLKPFAVYYDINDLDERAADDTIEVPVGDLRLARAFLARNGKGEG